MADDHVKSINPLTAGNSRLNADYSLVKRLLAGIETAIPVRVDAVEPGLRGPGGYLSATPLIAERDAWGDILEMPTIHHLPYFRLQAGVCAVIIDPVPGDIGIAVFAKRDISTLTTGAKEPVQPRSFRSFDASDGMYIGGILNLEPNTWQEFLQEGYIAGHAPITIRFEAVEENVEMDAGLDVTQDAGRNIEDTAAVDILIKAGRDISVEAVRHITVRAGGNITVRAEGNMDAEAKGNMRSKAGGDMDAEAVGTMSAKSGSDMTATSGANLTATAVGNVALSGANISLKTPGKLTISAARAEIATTGGVSMSGGLTSSGGIANSGGSTTSNGVVLETHIHGGVESGDGTTGGPV